VLVVHHPFELYEDPTRRMRAARYHRARSIWQHGNTYRNRGRNERTRHATLDKPAVIKDTAKESWTKLIGIVLMARKQETTGEDKRKHTDADQSYRVYPCDAPITARAWHLHRVLPAASSWGSTERKKAAWLTKGLLQDALLSVCARQGSAPRKC